MAPAPLTISLPQHPLAVGPGPPQALASALDGPPPPTGAEVVLRAGGMPALIAWERDGRRLVDLRLDLEHDTRFPLAPRSRSSWTISPGGSRDAMRTMSAVLAGEPLRWRVPATAPPAGDRSADRTARFLTTQQAGATIVAAADTTRRHLHHRRRPPVRRQPGHDGESDLSAAGRRRRAGDGIVRLSRRGPGGELAAGLLVAALLLLCLEWWYRGRWAVQA